MDISWQRRMAAMRRAHLGIISKADREIVGIYQRAAAELARKARNAKSGGLTERWLKDYSRSLTETIGQMRADIYGTVKDSMARSAQLPADATGDWMARALQASGLGADKSFTAILSRAPTDAIRSIIDGRMYRDGVTLSRRIWNQTGRLQWGIEEVITQGLAQQQGLKEISRALETYLNPDEAAPTDMRRLYPNMGEPGRGGQPIPATYQIEYNSQRLARTAINHAHWGANKQAAKDNPLCSGMRWVLSADHFARQVAKWGPDVCDDYARHDEGLGIGVYPVDKLPLPHPQCLCRQEQVVPSLDEAVNRLNLWLAGGSDPAMDAGFARAQKAAKTHVPVHVDSFKSANELPIVQRGAGRIGTDVAATIKKTNAKMVADYPVLEKMIQHIYVQREDGVAAFGFDIDPITGAFRAGISLDSGAWKSTQTITAVLTKSLADGDVKGITDPMAILAHEYGHALHTAAALKQIGYSLGAPMTNAQLVAVHRARNQMAQDAFVASGAFDGDEYSDADTIYRSIRNEMGSRATDSGAEFIAQSVAMVYNGNAGPIARAVVKFLRKRLM